MEKPKLSLREHNVRVIGEALLSDLNKWGTGRELDREPNPNCLGDRNALIAHFANCGGLEFIYTTHEIAA